MAAADPPVCNATVRRPWGGWGLWGLENEEVDECGQHQCAFPPAETVEPCGMSAEEAEEASVCKKD